MQEKTDKKQIVILSLKIVFTVLYVAGLIFAIYKQIGNSETAAIVSLALSITFFIFHIFAWISPRKLYRFCWKICSIFPSEDISDDYETYLSKIGGMGLGFLIAAVIFLIIQMIFLF